MKNEQVIQGHFRVAGLLCIAFLACFSGQCRSCHPFGKYGHVISSQLLIPLIPVSLYGTVEEVFKPLILSSKGQDRSFATYRIFPSGSGPLCTR